MSLGCIGRSSTLTATAIREVKPHILTYGVVQPQVISLTLAFLTVTISSWHRPTTDAEHDERRACEVVQLVRQTSGSLSSQTFQPRLPPNGTHAQEASRPKPMPCRMSRADTCSDQVSADGKKCCCTRENGTMHHSSRAPHLQCEAPCLDIMCSASCDGLCICVSCFLQYEE